MHESVAIKILVRAQSDSGPTKRRDKIAVGIKLRWEQGKFSVNDRLVGDRVSEGEGAEMTLGAQKRVDDVFVFETAERTGRIDQSPARGYRGSELGKQMQLLIMMTPQIFESGGCFEMGRSPPGS